MHIIFLGDSLKLLRNIFLIVILISSFYLVNYVSLEIKNNDPLMKNILNNKKDIIGMDAYIEGNYIVPGLSTKIVNVDKSYIKMKKYGYYHESLYVYDEILPRISINDNKGKIIKNGNRNKYQVVLIVDHKEVINYLKKNNIVFEDKNSINKYLYHIEPSYYLNHSNINKFREVLSRGDIIYLESSITLDEFYYINNIIKSKGLEIVDINTLIKE